MNHRFKFTQLLYKIFKFIVFFSTITWLMSTAFFLLVEGWHVKPISKAEIAIGNILTYLFNICFVLFVIVIARLMDLVLRDTNIITIPLNKPESKNSNSDEDSKED